jgi:cytochrome P450
VKAADVAHDPGTFSSREPNIYDDPPERPPTLPPVSLDPPVHAVYRRAMLPRFTPGAIDELVPATEAICNRLIDRFIDTGRADAGTDYAQHVPVLVTTEQFGLPASDADRIRRWMHEMIELGQDDLERGRRAALEVRSYFREHLARRRSEGGDDFIAWLTRAVMDGGGIPEKEQAASLIVLLIGGTDTTLSALGAALLHLATHPEDQKRLRAEPDLIETAVEEFLRFYAPLESGRVATRDAEVGGCPVTAGEHVWLSFPAACRDPNVFSEPDRFVIDRKENRHLAFGVGIHRCLGSNLARMELRVALRAWMERVPPFRVPDGATIEYSTGGNVRGPRRVPVVF